MPYTASDALPLIRPEQELDKDQKIWPNVSSGFTMSQTQPQRWAFNYLLLEPKEVLCTTASRQSFAYKKQDGKIQLFVIYSFATVLWEPNFSLCSSLSYNERTQCTSHFNFEPFWQWTHSNSQLDTALGRSIELPQLIPATNPTPNLKLPGKERRKIDTNCNGGSLAWQ